MVWFIPYYKTDIIYPSLVTLLPSLLIAFFIAKLKQVLRNLSFKFFNSVSTEKLTSKQIESSLQTPDSSYKAKELSEDCADLIIHTIFFSIGYILVERESWSDDLVPLMKIFPHQSLEPEQIIFHNIFLGYGIFELSRLNDPSLKTEFFCIMWTMWW